MTDNCPVCRLPYPWGDPAAIVGRACFECRSGLKGQAMTVIMSGVKKTRVHYIINQRYDIRFTAGPSADGDGWRWSDTQTAAVGGWHDSYLSALTELVAHIELDTSTVARP